MSKNGKQTTGRIASLAAQTLHDKNASKTAKSLAASALSQRSSSNQTGSIVEGLASKVLRSEKYADSTKELAGSVLSQANKTR